MKLAQLHEARYSGGSHPITDWIQQQIDDHEGHEEWHVEKRVHKKHSRQIHSALVSKFGESKSWIDTRQTTPDERMRTLGDRGVYTQFRFEWFITPTLYLTFWYSFDTGAQIIISTDDDYKAL